MAEAPRQRVFISYARKDAVRLALRLRKSLQTEYVVWLDTARIRKGASWTVQIEKAIDDSDVVLALLTPGSYVSDICRAEQLRALRQRKRVIPLLAAAGTDIPLHLETKDYLDFTGANWHDEQLQQLRQDIRTGRDAVVLQEKFRATRVTAPPLPRNYVERLQALERLRNVVVVDDPGPCIALTALRGMGGIGKTILAQALSHDEVVQQAFPDGVVWTTVGKDVSHDLVVRMQEIRRALGQEPARDETELQCINSYRTLVRQKAALVIVDDIWRTTDIEPFLAESRRSRLLFTTRDGAIAASLGAVEHTADLLTPAQSRTLLARWAGCETRNLPEQAGEIIDECDRLPLALSMIGAMLRGKPPAYVSHLLALLRQADLAKICGQFAFYPHADLLRAIQVSVDALEGRSRERYLALAALPEDMPAAPAVQQTLWNVDQGEALETAERFVSLSLAQREPDGESIRLHDLQLDYVHAKYADQNSLELIHSAVRLSAHVLEMDPRQFASQVLGRLLVHQDNAVIRAFSDGIRTGAPKPWLRVLHPTLHQSGTSLVRTRVGHSMHSGVAITADGKRAISLSPNATLTVWEVETGRVLCTLGGPSNIVSDIAMTPDGRRAVSAHPDRLEVWDLETQSRCCILGGLLGADCVAISPDGKRAISAFRSNSVDTMLGIRRVQSALPLTPAEEHAVSEALSHSITVWDTETGRPLQGLKGHTAVVTGIAIAAGVPRLVSGSADNSLRVWDLQTGRDVCILEGHHGSVTAVAVTSDGNRVLFGCGDGTLELRDVESGRELQLMADHSGAINCVAITMDGCRALSASQDHSLKVWDLRTGFKLRTLEGHAAPVNGLALAADGKRAVSTSEDGTLKVWDLGAGRDFGRTSQHSAAVNSVAVTTDGARAISASDDKTLKVWDMATGCESRTLTGHSYAVNCVALIPGRAHAVSASTDGTLRVWELDAGQCVRTFEGHCTQFNDVAITGDGKWAISISEAHICMWDIDAGRRVDTLAHGDFNMGGAVAVTPNGKQVLSASWGRTLRILDLETRRERILTGDSVNKVVVTADGKRAISGSVDFTVIVWDLATGVAMHTLYGHGAAVSDVAVAPDGKHAASACWDRVLRVWDIEAGLLMTSFYCEGPARCCALSNDGRIIVGDNDGRVYFLLLEN